MIDFEKDTQVPNTTPEALTGGPVTTAVGYGTPPQLWRTLPPVADVQRAVDALAAALDVPKAVAWRAHLQGACYAVREPGGFVRWVKQTKAALLAAAGGPFAGLSQPALEGMIEADTPAVRAAQAAVTEINLFNKGLYTFGRAVEVDGAAVDAWVDTWLYTHADPDVVAAAWFGLQHRAQVAALAARVARLRGSFALELRTQGGKVVPLVVPVEKVRLEQNYYDAAPGEDPLAVFRAVRGERAYDEYLLGAGQRRRARLQPVVDGYTVNPELAAAFPCPEDLKFHPKH